LEPMDGGYEELVQESEYGWKIIYSWM
jgi:hypothetical protein